MATKIDPSVHHPDFDEMEEMYDICEDAFEGDVDDYVEKLDGQSVKDRSAYLSRAAYFGVVGPTVTALLGAMTRKQFTFVGSQFPQTDFDSPNVFIQQNLQNILLGARTVMMVTVEDGKSKIVTYDPCDVVNWTDNFVMVCETCLECDDENPYLMVPSMQMREMYLDVDGFYRSRIWQLDKNKKWVATDLPDLLVNGKLIDYLPVFVATPYDNSWECYTPPLFTQAGLNIQHFKQSCDLAHYAHFMALPTAVISGDLYEYSNPDGTTRKAAVHLGSSKEVLHLQKDAKFEWGEVSGNSFKMLQDELKNIEERMYVAGSRLLTIKKGVESAEALQIRSGSESALLETIVTSYEAALRNAFALCSEIDRTPLEITMNRDFTAAVTDPATIEAMLKLYVAGAITIEQFQAQLIAGEVIDNPNN